jgi:DHA2 family methylenomycin A resistance protein-like MFS transporter
MLVEHRRAVVALALIASFMVFVDGTIVNLTVAQLDSSLGATRSQLEWTINAYTLTFAAVLLGAGAITDNLGAKRTFVAGLSVFAASSGLCALADSMAMLNGARLVQGVGAALLVPSALVLATAGARGAGERHRLVGWWAAAGGLGMAAGPLLGGALVSLVNWRAVFAVNLVIGIPALAWSVRVMPAVAGPRRHFDITGMLSAALLIGGLVFALIEAPGRGWLAIEVLIAITVAGVGLVGFCLAELAATAPLLPRKLYRTATFAVTAVQGALFNFTFYGLLFALGLMLQQGRGLSAIAAGVLFLPLTGLLPLGAIGAAPLARRRSLRTVLGAGQTLLVLSLLAAALVGSTHALWLLALALVPVGLSSGFLVPTMTSLSLADVEPGLHGAASSVFNTARQVGAAIGIATFGPLLGDTGDVTDGFAVCVLIGAVATAAALVLGAAGRPRRSVARSGSDLLHRSERTAIRDAGEIASGKWQPTRPGTPRECHPGSLGGDSSVHRGRHRCRVGR